MWRRDYVLPSWNGASFDVPSNLRAEAATVLTHFRVPRSAAASAADMVLPARRMALYAPHGAFAGDSAVWAFASQEESEISELIWSRYLAVPLRHWISTWRGPGEFVECSRTASNGPRGGEREEAGGSSGAGRKRRLERGGSSSDVEDGSAPVPMDEESFEDSSSDGGRTEIMSSTSPATSTSSSETESKPKDDPENPVSRFLIELNHRRGARAWSTGETTSPVSAGGTRRGPVKNPVQAIDQIVLGHTPQGTGRMRQVCDGLVWLTDIGISETSYNHGYAYLVSEKMTPGEHPEFPFLTLTPGGIAVQPDEENPAPAAEPTAMSTELTTEEDKNQSAETRQPVDHTMFPDFVYAVYPRPAPGEVTPPLRRERPSSAAEKQQEWMRRRLNIPDFRYFESDDTMAIPAGMDEGSDQ